MNGHIWFVFIAAVEYTFAHYMVRVEYRLEPLLAAHKKEKAMRGQEAYTPACDPLGVDIPSKSTSPSGEMATSDAATGDQACAGMTIDLVQEADADAEHDGATAAASSSMARYCSKSATVRRIGSTVNKTRSAAKLQAEAVREMAEAVREMGLTGANAEVRSKATRFDRLFISSDGTGMRMRDQHVDLCARLCFPIAYGVFLAITFARLPPETSSSYRVFERCQVEVLY